jgi:hypothetical protein
MIHVVFFIFRLPFFEFGGADSVAAHFDFYPNLTIQIIIEHFPDFSTFWVAATIRIGTESRREGYSVVEDIRVALRFDAIAVPQNFL